MFFHLFIVLFVIVIVFLSTKYMAITIIEIDTLTKSLKNQHTITKMFLKK